MPSLSAPQPPTDPHPPVTLAQLSVLNFSRLAAGDATETAALLRACETHGFFYLNLLDTADDILGQHAAVLRIMSLFFSQPAATKMAFDNGAAATHGYKPAGTQTGVVASTKDGFEALRFSHSKLHSTTPSLPTPIAPHLPTLRAFTAACHSVTHTLLTRLSAALPAAPPLTTAHPPAAPSHTNLVLLHYPACTLGAAAAGQNKHTDIGSLTLLFAQQWGLQVLAPASGAWEDVAPIPGHAVVNVGDCLRFLSGQRLRSALHRVVPFMGRQDERWSVAWFLRPADGTVVEAAGEPVEVGAWHDRKFGVYHQAHEEQRRGKVLLGGMEEVVGEV